ncbi:MAG: T9SS type A sorting domain-containing protein [Bacteroidota bacterium]
MRNNYLFFSLILLWSIQAKAQTTTELVSMGPNYAETAFYTLSTDSAVSYDHTMWDLMFSVDPRGSSVFFNEAVARRGDELELYLSTATDFASVDTTGMTLIRNTEISWDEGAFNTVKDVNDPFDQGWGLYNSVDRTVSSNRYFILKLRDGSMKKVEIMSLDTGVYTFRHADMDGSNEVTRTIDKANFAGKTMAYYSIVQDSIMDLEPAVWDFVFSRYYTPLDAGGTTIDYMVTGILTNAGVEVAQADDIDPATVNYMDYDTAYSSVLTTMGHDWKDIDATFQFFIVPNRVYFIKNAQNELWKVEFIDFTGSSLGETTFEQTFETNVTSINDLDFVESYAVYPNPATDQINIAFEISKSIKDANIEIYNTIGQQVLNKGVQIHTGLNVYTLPIDLESGVYHVSIRVKEDLITKMLMVK